MRYCQDCGSEVQPLYTRSSGCGGRGSMKVCQPCDTIWEQRSGGILPTPGGEFYGKFMWPFSEYRKHLISDIKPYQNRDNQKWYYWDEFYDEHGPFESEAMAADVIKNHLKQHNVIRCYLCRRLALEEHTCKKCVRCQGCGCYENCAELPD